MINEYGYNKIIIYDFMPAITKYTISAYQIN